MRIVEAIAKTVSVNVDNGTHVRMVFSVPPPSESAAS
jgi:hypothetical protein